MKQRIKHSFILCLCCNIFVFSAVAQRNDIKKRTILAPRPKISLIEYEYYSEGKKDILHGMAKEYWDNGNLKKTLEYKCNKKNGKYQEFYTDGKILEEGFYINDTINMTKYWFPDRSYIIHTTINNKHFTFLYDSLGNQILSQDDSIMSYFRAVHPDESISWRYPRKLRKNELEGRVVLKLTIGFDGNIEDIDCIKSFHPIACEHSKNTFKRFTGWGKKVEGNLPKKWSLYLFVNYKLI
jgi:hypothetical protein